MSKLDRVTAQLERGHELCGVCGKDVTGARDCVHESIVNLNTLMQTVTAKGFSIPSQSKSPSKPYSIRIGMEMLMYPEELLALPLFDIERFDVGLNKMYREAAVRDSPGSPYMQPLVAQSFYESDDHSES